jgi:CheY-like chemotaxis protein
MKRQLAILVIEDDPNDQALIERAFRKLTTGSVHMVCNGLEAIAYMMGESQYSDRLKFPYPSFITTDLKMPGADGFAVLEHLKANPAWAIIPTVVLSSSEDPDDIRTAYLLGASSYHVKPATFDELQSQLEIIYGYWMICRVPEVGTNGMQVCTISKGKLGERFPQPRESSQKRVWS